jgi:hypothetical protein
LAGVSTAKSQVKEFTNSEHGAAWAAMEAMPTIHWQPLAMTNGMKGCGACHKLGLKSERFAKSQDSIATDS